jgi:hypothetical protein
MLTTPIIGLLSGIAIISVLGILSARAAHSVRKEKRDNTTVFRVPPKDHVVKDKDELDGNKSNPGAMGMAAHGNKN